MHMHRFQRFERISIKTASRLVGVDERTSDRIDQEHVCGLASEHLTGKRIMVTYG